MEAVDGHPSLIGIGNWLVGEQYLYGVAVGR